MGLVTSVMVCLSEWKCCVVSGDGVESGAISCAGVWVDYNGIRISKEEEMETTQQLWYSPWFCAAPQRAQINTDQSIRRPTVWRKIFHPVFLVKILYLLSSTWLRCTDEWEYVTSPHTYSSLHLGVQLMCMERSAGSNPRMYQIFLFIKEK